jgi:hypothetical protein
MSALGGLDANIADSRVERPRQIPTEQLRLRELQLSTIGRLIGIINSIPDEFYQSDDVN